MSINIVLSIILALNPLFSHAITLIFDPAGDAKHPGRVIGFEQSTQMFERTATLYLTQHIKDHITSLDKRTIVLFSRLPGEQKDPLEKMRFVQQCNADIFIHIAVYQSSHIKPQIHFYYNAQNGSLIKPNNILTPITQTHTAYISRSKELLENIFTTLQIDTQRICDLHQPIGIPCKALIGIAAPACIIEIGVKDAHDLENCIIPLAKSIFKACTGKGS